MFKTRSQLLAGTSALAAVVAASLAMTAQAAGAPPPNDNYLDSFRINDPGRKLNRVDHLGGMANTVQATTQTDVFSPPGSGGGPEPTRCGSTTYGRTVWYDFYPDVTGLVRLQANGYDAVLRAVPFARTTGRPDFAKSLCFNGSSSTAEEFFVKVKKGGSYTVQVGAVNNVGGMLDFGFDFLADTDGDNVLDDNDRCPKIKGTGKDGCPPRLNADVTITAKPTAAGIQLVNLAVAATRSSRIEVTCSRNRCRKQVVRKARGSTSFRRLRGVNLPAHTDLVIRVNKRGAIGRYIRYRISPGNFKKTVLCTNPGSRKPRRHCG